MTRTSLSPISLTTLLWLIFLLPFTVQASNLLQPQDELSSQAQSEPEFLKVDEAFQFSSELKPDGIQLHWDIADNYYLYFERMKFKSDDPNVKLGTPQFSTQGEPKMDEYFGEVNVIHHALDVFLPVTLSGGKTEADVQVSYQGCAEAGLCYPPRKQQILFVGSAPDQTTPATSAAPAKTDSTSNNYESSDGISSFLQSASLPLIIGIFFLLGLGLTFTPCVFPMIPIMTSIIAGQVKPTPMRSFLLALAYVLGMAITYAAAGVLTGLLGAGANISAAMQDPIILSVFALVFFLLALAMFGLYELQLPSFIRDRLNTTSQNISGGQITGVFFIGALSALVVSPCVSAPLAGALIYISSTGDAVVGGLSLLAMGLGMGVPLILIAVGGGALLPKAGAWMNAVKAVFGVMLMGVAIYLLSRFVDPTLSMVLWSALLVLSASQMGAFDAAASGWQRLFKGTGLLMALWGFAILLGALTGTHNPLRPLENLGGNNAAINTTNTGAAPTASYEFNVIYDQSGLARHLELARQAGKPVLLDFYADWCASCITMENKVFPRPDIAALLSQAYLIKADVTENDAGNQTLLKQFGLFGPPSMIFYDRQGQEIAELKTVGEISANEFKARMQKLF